jgi:hypothetical protein
MNRIGRALLVALVLAACADDDDTVDTLDPLQNGQSTVTGTATEGSSPDTTSDGLSVPSSAPFQAAGEGMVSIQVRLAASGLDETLSLDRATIPADELDPISLFASCTAIDGAAAAGEVYVVRVIDLRRLTSDDELVAAALSVDTPLAAPGEYDVTLELSDVTQKSTTYSGTLTVDRGLSAGTFEVVDERGNAATGSFSCTRPPPPTTTAPSTSAAVTSTSPGTTTFPGTTLPATTLAGATTSVAISTTTVVGTSPPPGT